MSSLTVCPNCDRVITLGSLAAHLALCGSPINWSCGDTPTTASTVLPSSSTQPQSHQLKEAADAVTPAHQTAAAEARASFDATDPPSPSPTAPPVTEMRLRRQSEEGQQGAPSKGSLQQYHSNRCEQSPVITDRGTKIQNSVTGDPLNSSLTSIPQPTSAGNHLTRAQRERAARLAAAQARANTKQEEAQPSHEPVTCTARSKTDSVEQSGEPGQNRHNEARHCVDTRKINHSTSIPQHRESTARREPSEVPFHLATRGASVRRVPASANTQGTTTSSSSTAIPSRFTMSNQGYSQSHPRAATAAAVDAGAATPASKQSSPSAIRFSAQPRSSSKRPPYPFSTTRGPESSAAGPSPSMRHSGNSSRKALFPAKAYGEGTDDSIVSFKHAEGVDSSNVSAIITSAGAAGNTDKCGDLKRQLSVWTRRASRTEEAVVTLRHQLQQQGEYCGQLAKSLQAAQTDIRQLRNAQQQQERMCAETAAAGERKVEALEHEVAKLRAEVGLLRRERERQQQQHKHQQVPVYPSPGAAVKEHLQPFFQPDISQQDQFPLYQEEEVLRSRPTITVLADRRGSSASDARRSSGVISMLRSRNSNTASHAEPAHSIHAPSSFMSASASTLPPQGPPSLSSFSPVDVIAERLRGPPTATVNSSWMANPTGRASYVV